MLEYVTATRDATGAACSWLVTIGGQKMVATAVGFFRHRAANGDNNQIASALGRAVLPPRARCLCQSIKSSTHACMVVVVVLKLLASLAAWLHAALYIACSHQTLLESQRDSSCLVAFKIPKFYKISHHIKILNAYIKY